MNEKEFKLFKQFLKENAHSSEMVDIPSLVADFEEYVANKKIRITNDKDLKNACNHFLRANDMESLINTEVVEEILNYVDENYN